MYTPLVTVVVPFHNTEKTIYKCLQTVVALEYSQLEIILVDDASTDWSSECASSYTNCHSYRGLNIQLITLPEKGGVSAARHKALSVATGEYITFVDADDYIDPDAIDAYVAATDNGRYDIVAAGVNYRVPGHDVPHLFKRGERLSLDEAKIDSLHFLLTNKLLRTEKLRSVSPFTPGQDCWEDLGAISRMLAAGATTTILNGAWYHYVQYNKGSLTKSDPDMILRHHLAVTKSLEEWMRENGYAEKNSAFLDYVKFIAKVKYLRNFRKVLLNPIGRLLAWRDTFPEVNHKILSFSKVGLHYRLLFTVAWLLSVLIPIRKKPH